MFAGGVLEAQAQGELSQAQQPGLVAELLEPGDPQADDHQPHLEPLPLGQLHGVLAAAGEVGHQAQVDQVGLGEVEAERRLRLDRCRAQLLGHQQPALVHRDAEPALGDPLGLVQVGHEHPGPAPRRPWPG